MQSTEEYLDQLLASVSDEEPQKDTNIKTGNPHRKSIEELDESELTEEALQKQLALLLGLESEDEEEYAESEDDFMTEYSAQMTTADLGSVDFEAQEIPTKTVEAAMPQEVQENVSENVVVAETEPVSVAAAEPTNTGVLSADEIAALFASMEAEAEELPEASISEEAKEEPFTEEVKGEPIVVREEPKAEPTPAPSTSDSGILSPDEIAALFASMGTDDASESAESEETDITDEVLLGENKNAVEDSLTDDFGGLTREELEELGLGDIADVLVDGEQEILSESIFEELTVSAEGTVDMAEMPITVEDTIANAEENQIVEIPDFDFGEEVLLDLENIDEMLEATAKLAEEESASVDSDLQTSESIDDLLLQLQQESIQESMTAREESAKAAEEAVNKVLEPDDGVPAELLENEEGGKKKRRKNKKEKVKKEKVKKEKPVKEKKDKGSLKDKITAFMFEDDSLDDGKVPLGDGDELAYMDIPMEEIPVKKKKEKLSKKDKKAKANKDDGKAKDENAEIAAELAAEDKKKAKKKEKPKKEKKIKKVVISDKNSAEEERKEPKRGIGTKGIAATLLVCASILGLILVGSYFLPKQLSLVAARNAFYAGNYEEAAMRLKGKELNDSDRILYEKASLLYGLEERYHQSDIYLRQGKTKENLNALLQGVVACNKEEILATQLGIEREWKLMKDQFINALQAQYGLDLETVEAICLLRNPDYTVAVENILAGRWYSDMSAYGGGTDKEEVPVETPEEMLEEVGETENGNLKPEEMEDLLPEEEAIIEQMQREEALHSQGGEDATENGDKELFAGSVEGGAVNFVE